MESLQAKVGKPRLSATQLDMLARCGMQYQFRYIEGIKAPPGVAMVIGTGTHAAVEWNLKAKQQTGVLLPAEQVQQLAVDAVKRTWDQESPALSADEHDQGEATVRGNATDTAAMLALTHHTKLAPKIEPVHVEREFTLALEGFPYDLYGWIDVQERATIRDTKTASKSPSGDEAERSTQLTVYALAAKTLDGAMPDRVVLDYLVKTKEPKAVTVEAHRDDEDLARILLRVGHAADVIQKGAFYPTSPDNWWCSARWCGYWNRCPFGAKQRIQG